MSFSVPGGTPKKDSIFSSLAPAQPAPMPAPAPAPLPRPAADSEAVNALKQKIDLMERKLAEQLKAAASAPAPQPAPPPQNDLLARKMDDLERRICDFGQAAAVSASQLKNIEESKIAARREIEDLLKAVREQQKYSEMDRQMHDQLEKAWSRAEDLEKKLMDFYASVLDMETRRRTEAASASDRSVAALEALSSRMEKLEQRLSAAALDQSAQEARKAQEELMAKTSRESAELLAALAQAGAETRKAQEEFMARAARESASLLAAQEAAGREALTGFRETSASLREFFDNNFRREMALLNERVSSETSALRREVTSSLEESRKVWREQSSALADKTSSLERSVDAAAAASAGQVRALEEFAGRMEASLRAISGEYMAAVKKDGEERFSRFSAKYADALLTVTFVENFRAAVAAATDKLEAHETTLKEFLANVTPAQLGKLLGVSGELIRKNFDAMTVSAAGLKEDVTSLREIKREIERKVRDIFGES
jgi:hypothetical protein